MGDSKTWTNEECLKYMDDKDVNIAFKEMINEELVKRGFEDKRNFIYEEAEYFSDGYLECRGLAERFATPGEYFNVFSF
ncbi:MAG: hypothetical protein KAI81_03010 [Candidatus Marinimicrobia bacterium]|nr:hypothetical protein [Candidatus Neomarinimicrobiota bacterium]